MKNILLYWFKVQAAKAARKQLIYLYDAETIRQILSGYWLRYQMLKHEVPAMPTLGGSVMVHLAAMSTAFYQELTARGLHEETATRVFYDIAWKVYVKMGRFSWWLAGWGNRDIDNHLLKTTKLFRAFPFNSPSYEWQDVQTANNVVGFDCVRCPVAEYFLSKGLSKFCTKTWCSLDYRLAELWHAKLERTGTIAGGAD
ncbi:MAG: L-2-amino-thiazoline-4-carboxylic acid hydrolase, partial [Ferruginibacter sp.]